MHTVPRNIFRYLSEQKLIESSALVDGGITLAISRSRNRFLFVKQREGASYFIKQGLETEAGTRESVAREAEIYRAAYGDERLASLRELLPKCHFYDDKQGILITDLVPDAQNLAIIHLKLGACPEDLARRVGQGIASYHQIRFVAGAPQAKLFTQQPPWILQLHSEVNIRALRRSPAASELIDIMLADIRLGEDLTILRQDWRRDTLIHNDIRWENILLTPNRLPIAKRSVYIVDWELADIGDAAWDVAGLLQAYIVFWLSSMSAEPGLDDRQRLSTASRPLAMLQQSIISYWEGYIESSEIYINDTDDFLRRCVRMMGARILVTAFEMSARATQLDNRIPLFIRTAADILRDPDRAIDNLLGMRGLVTHSSEQDHDKLS